MVSASIWKEEWRSFPHGPDPASVWVIVRRGESPEAPISVLARYEWPGGVTSMPESADMPPLNAAIQVLESGLTLRSGGMSAWPLCGQDSQGALLIRHPERDPWRATIRSWGKGLAARLTALVDSLPLAPADSRFAPMTQQPSLFPALDPKPVITQLSRGFLPLPRPRTVPGVPGLVASSREMLACCEAALSVAATGVNVLIHGESGTGKEVLAHTIHAGSHRRDAPFIGVNCAALPESLFESELFGHKAGAFTGAGREKTGLLEAANGGTFFLDEIGDMPIALQIKLLRVLQERRLRRIGDVRDRPVDVRFVSASHRDLDSEVAAGRFRLDLFYRLKVVRLVIPALRHRPEDVAPLLSWFLERQGRDIASMGVTPGALKALQSYRWPGNVRELENEVSRWLALNGSESVIRVEQLSIEVRKSVDPSTDPADLGTLRPMGEATQLLERYLIRKAIDTCRGRKSDAARRLGLSRQGLYKKIRRYGMLDLLQPAS